MCMISYLKLVFTASFHGNDTCFCQMLLKDACVRADSFDYVATVHCCMCLMTLRILH